MADDDTRALLGRLRIDRDAPPQRRVGRAGVLVIGGVAVVAAVVLWQLDGAGAAPEAGAGVETALVTQPSSRGESVLDASGYVIARRQATVSSKQTGKVQEVLIEEGMVVAAGQLLARLEDTLPRSEYALREAQVDAARATLIELRVQIEQARLDHGRTTGLAAGQLASAADVDRTRLALAALDARLERAQRDVTVAERALALQQRYVDDTEIRAPFAGVVVAKAAQPGEMISPVSAGGGFTRTGICTLVDMDSLEVEVDVNEAYINRVQAGQAVGIALNAYPDERLPGSVIAIIPAADRNKATVRVRVGFAGRDARILPDMGVKVSFLGAHQPEQPQAPLVPASAVFDRAGQPHVFVVVDGRLARREVRLGSDAAGRVAVLSGLQGGERVVTAPAGDTGATLVDGMAVEVVR
jgi:RND family efflux transporter MFP subunit